MFGIIGALLFGTVYAGSAIKCGLENKESMSRPSYYLKDGTPVYRDRTGETYINGEKTYEEYKIDSYGHEHWMTVGCQTGKIYQDSWNDYLDKLNKEINEEIERQKKEGKLAYVRYYPNEDKRLTTEISTGKVIAKLESRVGVCRKWYRAKNAKSSIDIEEGDAGIEISREEFEALNIIFGSHFVFEYTEEMLKRDQMWKETVEFVKNAKEQQEKSDLFWKEIKKEMKEAKDEQTRKEIMKRAIEAIEI